MRVPENEYFQRAYCHWDECDHNELYSFENFQIFPQECYDSPWPSAPTRRENLLVSLSAWKGVDFPIVQPCINFFYRLQQHEISLLKSFLNVQKCSCIHHIFCIWCNSPQLYKSYSSYGVFLHNYINVTDLRLLSLSFLEHEWPLKSTSYLGTSYLVGICNF
jgi:hypothetical protein